MLGSAGGSAADGAPADDPVTSLDMFVGSDYLVAGHGSGQVFLWDYLRYGTVRFGMVDGGGRMGGARAYAHARGFKLWSASFVELLFSTERRDVLL